MESFSKIANNFFMKQYHFLFFLNLIKKETFEFLSI